MAKKRQKGAELGKKRAKSENISTIGHNWDHTAYYPKIPHRVGRGVKAGSGQELIRVRSGSSSGSDQAGQVLIGFAQVLSGVI